VDGETFDRLLRRTVQEGSRRGVLRTGLSALVASIFAGLGLDAVEEAAAKNAHRVHKRRMRKRRLRRAAKQRRGVPGPPGPPGPGAQPQTCTAERPVSCGSGCCPTALPVCCDDQADVDGKRCWGIDQKCCPLAFGGGPCPRSMTCCPPRKFETSGNCVDSPPYTCCPQESGGACFRDEHCCPTALTNKRNFGCCPDGRDCCGQDHHCPEGQTCEHGCCFRPECGGPCPPNEICYDGENCLPLCPEGNLCLPGSDAPDCCDGGCSNFQTDHRNCGSCGHACEGSCCVGGQCVDLGSACQDDAECCGESTGWVCTDGACSRPKCQTDDDCPQNRFPWCCNGECASLYTDPNNCGECGNQCSAGWSCFAENLCRHVPPGETNTCGCCHLVGEACEVGEYCCSPPNGATHCDPATRVCVRTV
jgi:hypothetical protein